ncbi:Protein of unknown function DUF104 [Geoglobus ahangari]|uniref:Antitoxin n=1 Tax=Geoglobus ahangari TaxID=113653 RepID=A0A0F7IFE3_9EURY|nr:antitoxin family protein [Geoglobus ahangari]AKG92352.1 Protein of unknown function DUF104 [Geoglobus ahangari]
MPEVIEVIYENGVLKPVGKVNLKEGERLKVILKRVDLEEFVMAKLPENKIKELEERFESEGVH